jgi:hypothetical protein
MRTSGAFVVLGGFMETLMVTGSRDWTDRQTMFDVFMSLSYDSLVMYGGVDIPVRVIHGNQVGADLMAAEIAESIGFTVQAFPWDDNLSSPYKYHKRNDQMLAENPGMVWAFRQIGAANRGTDSVIRKAEKKGIRVVKFESARVYEVFPSPSQ